MRVTTNMIMKNFQYRLNDTLTQQTKHQYQVMTGKKYQNAWESPLDNAVSANLVKRYLRNEDYLTNISDMQSYQDAQENASRQVLDIAKEIDANYSVQAMNDTNGLNGRKVFAAALRGYQESMLKAVNEKYGDDYVMAGADGKNAPFRMEGGKLLYRGIDVNDGNMQQLDALSKEHVYVDLGFGLTFENDKVVDSSAFDTSFPGINILGYGKNAEGTSQNMIVLAGQMADVLEKEPFDSGEYEKLWKQFHEQTNHVTDTVANIGNKAQLLNSTKDRLEDLNLSLSEQLNNVVGINPADAIMRLSWSQFAYNSALRIGNNIISPSLLDFMK